MNNNDPAMYAYAISAAGRIFLQSDIKDAATSMFEEFTEHGSAALRPHGSAAFRPDCSGALLSENVLPGAATLGLTRGSSTSDLRAESHSGHDRPHSHEEQGSSGPEEFPQNDRLVQQEDASAGDDMSVTDQSHTVSSHAQQGWPPDIEWLQDNPLVGNPSLTSWPRACNDSCPPE